VLGDSDFAHRTVTILDREANIYSSTNPSEIVTCVLDGCTEVQLLCKYGCAVNKDKWGHHNDLTYEAGVYEQVLSELKSSTPKFYGLHVDKGKSQPWLILEYIDRGVRLSKAGWFFTEEGVKTSDPRCQAARWIGHFHAANEARLGTNPMAFLRRYDAEYYLGWARRTSRFAGHMHKRFPWLHKVCERFEELIPMLTAPPLTIVHGEYYPHNILFRDGIVCPIDWQSAAVARGEIDLASLEEGWPEDFAQKFELEYRQARWPKDEPAGFERNLEAARLYLNLRWLGDRREWTIGKCESRFAQLQASAIRFGLI
jgi:aminoglycoside phosphotransferase (APT) family kinase protein